MTICGDVCPREAEGEATYSSKPVADDEWVCRSVRPQDYTAAGVVKSGFVHAKRLKEGWLSAWRIDDIDKMASIEHKMADTDGPPSNVIAVKASALRSIRIRGERAVCVINDTRITEDGAHDPLHVAISGCSKFMPWTDDQASKEDFEELRSQIMLAFRSAQVSLRSPK